MYQGCFQWRINEEIYERFSEGILREVLEKSVDFINLWKIFNSNPYKMLE